MTTGTGFAVPLFTWFYQGAVAANGSVYVYQTGTTTPVSIYADSGLITPLSNPLNLDANGQCSFYVSGAVNLRMDGYTGLAGAGALIKSIDPVYPIGGNQSSVVITGGTIDGAVIGGTTAAAGTFTALKANTPSQGDSSTSVATTAFFGQNIPGGFINKFRNATMQIAQRGTGNINVSTGNANYTLDGWIVGATGATVVSSQSYQIGIGGNALQLVGAVSMTDTFIKQRLESYLCYPFATSKNVTVQATIYNNTGASITPTLTVKHPTGVDNWAGTATDVNAVNLQACQNGTATIVAYTFTPSTSSVNGLEITFDFGATLNSNAKSIGFGLADIRVTPGVTTGLNSAPPLIEILPLGVDLLFNQRYFTTTFGNNNTPAQSFGLSGALAAQPYGATAGEVYTQWNFPVQMRASPTIVTYNPAAGNANWRDVTGVSDVVVNVDPDSAKGIQGVMIGSQTTALTAGHHLYIHATASAEL